MIRTPVLFLLPPIPDLTLPLTVLLGFPKTQVMMTASVGRMEGLRAGYRTAIYYAVCDCQNRGRIVTRPIVC